MFAADYGLIYWAEQYIESGLTAVLFATLPLMTLFVARAYLPGERITARKAHQFAAGPGRHDCALRRPAAPRFRRRRSPCWPCSPPRSVRPIASVVSKRDAHDLPVGDAERAVDADWSRCTAGRLAGARRRLPAARRRRHMGRRSVPVGRRDGARLFCLLFAAQDVDA